MTMAAASAPISGRASVRDSSERGSRTGGADPPGAGGCEGGCPEGWVATDELIAGSKVERGRRGAGPTPRLPPTDYRVFFSVKGMIGPTFFLSTIDGPVRTGPPPPMSFPLVRFSHNDVTAM